MDTTLPGTRWGIVKLMLLLISSVSYQVLFFRAALFPLMLNSAVMLCNISPTLKVNWQTQTETRTTPLKAHYDAGTSNASSKSRKVLSGSEHNCKLQEKRTLWPAMGRGTSKRQQAERKQWFQEEAVCRGVWGQLQVGWLCCCGAQDSGDVHKVKGLLSAKLSCPGT